MTAPLKLGTIGAGIMGRRLIEAAASQADGPLLPHAVFDPDRSASDRLRAQFHDIVVCDTADEAIARCDVLHVASPPSSHLSYLDAIVAARKACLCEKPLAIDPGAAQISVAAAKRARGRVAVNFPFASSLAVATLGNWISSHEIGKVECVEIELSFADWPRPWQADAVRWLDGRAEGGFLREVGSHFLFLARRLFGELRIIEASTAYPPQAVVHVASVGGGFVAPPPALSSRSERRVRARLSAGIVPVVLEGSIGTTPKADHNVFLVRGTKGELRLRDWSIAERRAEDGIWHEAPDAVANEQARMINLRRQLGKLAALARGEPQDLATLDEALDVQLAVESILAA